MTTSRHLLEVSAEDRLAEIDFQATRLSRHLTDLEAAARAAESGRLPASGWAPFSLDTGLTPAQETFILDWSPAAVLHQCRAQREELGLIRGWLVSNPPLRDLDFALALVSTLSDAVPT